MATPLEALVNAAPTPVPPKIPERPKTR